MDRSRRRSSLPGWLLDEVASAGRENVDVDHVTWYDDIADAGGAAEVALPSNSGWMGIRTWWTSAQVTGQFTVAAPVCLVQLPSTYRR